MRYKSNQLNWKQTDQVQYDSHDEFNNIYFIVILT